MDAIKISDREVSYKEKPLVIAELGINHGGKIEEALKIVDSAARAGVEIIKHQTHVVEDEMSPSAKEILPGNSKKNIYQIMSECALNEDDEIKLKDYIESKGIIFISTPFSRAAADRLEKMDVPAYKIGSGECNNFPLLKHIASFGKPIILSTGMNTMENVSKAIDILESYGTDHAILHTTNLYPTPPHLVRLGAITELKNKFPDKIIGLSDHTTNNLACFGAVALGASILERHYTDTLARKGPDISCSMDELQCRDLIEGSQILALERGGNKEPAIEEQVTMDFAFATVVSIKPIKKGDVFDESNIWVKRPGSGEIPASSFESVIGKISNKNLKEGTHLSYCDILS